MLRTGCGPSAFCCRAVLGGGGRSGAGCWTKDGGAQRCRRLGPPLPGTTLAAGAHRAGGAGGGSPAGPGAGEDWRRATCRTRASDSQEAAAPHRHDGAGCRARRPVCGWGRRRLSARARAGCPACRCAACRLSALGPPGTAATAAAAQQECGQRAAGRRLPPQRARFAGHPVPLAAADPARHCGKSAAAAAAAAHPGAAVGALRVPRRHPAPALARSSQLHASGAHLGGPPGAA